jgi:hypothetical protein
MRLIYDSFYSLHSMSKKQHLPGIYQHYEQLGVAQKYTKKFS